MKEVVKGHDGCVFKVPGVEECPDEVVSKLLCHVNNEADNSDADQGEIRQYGAQPESGAQRRRNILGVLPTLAQWTGSDESDQKVRVSLHIDRLDWILARLGVVLARVCYKESFRTPFVKLNTSLSLSVGVLTRTRRNF